jgi:hypothetical protein
MVHNHGEPSACGDGDARQRRYDQRGGCPVGFCAAAIFVDNSITGMRSKTIEANRRVWPRSPNLGDPLPTYDNALKRRAAQKLATDWKPVHEFLPRLEGSSANHPQKWILTPLQVKTNPSDLAVFNLPRDTE